MNYEYKLRSNLGLFSAELIRNAYYFVYMFFDSETIPKPYNSFAMIDYVKVKNAHHSIVPEFLLTDELVSGLNMDLLRLRSAYNNVNMDIVKVTTPYFIRHLDIYNAKSSASMYAIDFASFKIAVTHLNSDLLKITNTAGNYNINTLPLIIMQSDPSVPSPYSYNNVGGTRGFLELRG